MSVTKVSVEQPRLQRVCLKLDSVSPVDNRPFTDQLNCFIPQKKKNKKIRLNPDTWHLTLDTWHLTLDTWHVTHDMWNMMGGELIWKVQLSRFGMDSVLKILNLINDWITKVFE